jgi:hypothetical protein
VLKPTPTHPALEKSDKRVTPRITGCTESGRKNNNVNDKTELAGFLAKEFGLVHHTTDGLPKPTTLSRTCIDHAFLRNMNTECMPYVSYFSYHRPLLNRLLVPL